MALQVRDFNILEVLLNKPFLAAIIAQVTSQVFKIFLPVFKGKPPDIRKFADYGDIPSAHTAFIVGATVGLGLDAGWNSNFFGFAVVVAGILIYDIIKLRKTVEVNLTLTKLLAKKAKVAVPKDIPQFKGHSIAEVITGGVWGTICAIVVHLIKY